MKFYSDTGDLEFGSKSPFSIWGKNSRNRLGGATHSGIIPEIIAKKTINELHLSLMVTFRKLTSTYTTLDLIYPQSMKKSSGLYTIRIQKLHGTHYPFSEEEIHSEVDMNTESLYLFNRVSGTRLELLSEFIRKLDIMGSIINAQCDCGCEREMSLGGGMTNFQKNCGFLIPQPM